MTDKQKDERQEVLAAVKRLLARVPDEPLPVDAKPRWHASEKKTAPDSAY